MQITPLMRFALLAFFLLLLAMSSMVSQGCKHRPIVDVEIPPDDTTSNPVVHPCHPDTVYFELQVLPLLVSNCAMPGCHSAVYPADGVNLTSYLQVMATADIKPGKLDGKLWDMITESDPKDRMPPPPNPPLSPDQIQIIRTWLLQGAQNRTCTPDNTQCDTLNMSFAGHIQPVLQQYCTGCHGGSIPQAGINLSNFTGVSAVIPGNRLLGAVKHQSGFKPMPPAGNPLPDCRVRQLEAWINQGAKNN
jgi:hypothetical protein